MVAIFLRIIFGAAAAVMFAVFIIPMFSNVINLGNIAGALLSMWIIFVCVKPMFSAARQACSSFAVTRVLFWGANGILAAFLIYGAVISCFMFSAASKSPAPNATAVVLGAQVKPTGEPSRILMGRINAAQAYLAQSPQSTAVLSGGKGTNEASSEAECMYRTLSEMGVNSKRLYREDESENTMQNLEYSMRVIEEKGLNTDIVIVTDGFHQLRAQLIAGKQGIKGNVGAVSSDTEPLFLPTYVVREWLALPIQLFR